MLVLLLPHNARVFVWFSFPRLQRTLEKENKKKNKENKFQHLTLCIAKRASLTSEVQLYAEHNLWAFRQMCRINT